MSVNRLSTVLKFEFSIQNVYHIVLRKNKLFNRFIFFFLQGTVTQRNFGDIQFKLCPTETFAREFFKKRGVEHYWDLVYGTSILEAAEDS